MSRDLWSFANLKIHWLSCGYKWRILLLTLKLLFCKEQITIMSKVIGWFIVGTTELSHSFFFAQLCPALSHPSRAYHHEQKTDGWFVLFSESSDKINVKTCIFLINFVNMTLLLTCKFRTVGTSASFASLDSNVEEESQASWEWIPFYAKIVRLFSIVWNTKKHDPCAATNDKRSEIMSGKAR